jgi:hypothetical protein
MSEDYAERLARIEMVYGMRRLRSEAFATNEDIALYQEVPWLLAQIRERDRELWWQREMEQTEIGELMARVDAQIKRGEVPSLDDAKAINGWLVWHVENFVNPQDYEGAVWGRRKAEARIAQYEAAVKSILDFAEGHDRLHGYADRSFASEVRHRFGAIDELVGNDAINKMNDTIIERNQEVIELKTRIAELETQLAEARKIMEISLDDWSVYDDWEEEITRVQRFTCRFCEEWAEENYYSSFYDSAVQHKPDCPVLHRDRLLGLAPETAHE